MYVCMYVCMYTNTSFIYMHGAILGSLGDHLEGSLRASWYYLRVIRGVFRVLLGSFGLISAIKDGSGSGLLGDFEWEIGEGGLGGQRKEANRGPRARVSEGNR